MKNETKNLGPIDVVCDAPPYSIIQACSRVGIERPEDVRWARMSQFLNVESFGYDSPSVQTWKSFFIRTKASQATCSCKTSLPHLDRCTFTYITGREISYLIGQCRRCKTVFWEET